jgi:hypothetical protein
MTHARRVPAFVGTVLLALGGRPCSGHAKDFSQLVKAACCVAIGSFLIFLNLLERYAHRFG